MWEDDESEPQLEEEETEHHGSSSEPPLKEEEETEHHGSTLLNSDLGEYLSVIIEIFIKLPMKTIFLAKCVSKNWRSLTTNPEFVHCYTEKWNKNVEWKLFSRCVSDDFPAVINTGDDHESMESQGFALRFLPSTRLSIIASDNGLLLCSNMLEYQIIYDVCNPITMKLVTLPKHNPELDLVNTGFIFNKIDNSYKVVRIPAEKHFAGEISLEIYSSETGEWRHSIANVPWPGVIVKPDPLVISFNGYLHFQEFKKNKIIVFDPNQQERQELCCFDLPKDEKIGTRRGIGVCCDELCFFDVSDDPSRNLGYLRKWVLVDYKNKIWELKFKLNFSQLWTDDHINIFLDPPDIWLNPLVIHPFKSNVMYYKILIHNQLVSCDLETGKFELVKKRHDRSLLLAFVVPLWPTVVT